MSHDKGSHVLHEVDIFVTDSISRFLAERTVCTDIGSTRCFDRHPTIESRSGSFFHVRTITKPLILEEAVDDVYLASIRRVLVGAMVRLFDVDSMLANR